MHPFTLSRADDSAKAITAHALDSQLAFIAGGTDLLGLMKDRAALPERLLDINGLPDMARIEALPDGSIRIGALARMSDVAANAEVRRRFPLITDNAQARACARNGDRTQAKDCYALLRYDPQFGAEAEELTQSRGHRKGVKAEEWNLQKPTQFWSVLVSSTQF